jgi:hypothetical protein
VTITASATTRSPGNTGGSGIVVTGPGVVVRCRPGGTFDTVAGGVLAIGASGDGVGLSGVVLNSVSGDLSHTTVNVFADGGTGLRVGGTGAYTGAAGMRFRHLNPGTGVVEATGGPAVDINATTADLRLATLRSTNSSTTGVSLVSLLDGTGTTAQFSAGAGSTISGASGTAFLVDGGNATVSYGGTIGNTAGRSAVVQNRTGTDTVAFTGGITDTGTGILLSANSAGTTTTFSGGLSLTTGTNAAFTATSGGVLNVCDENPCNPGATGGLVNTITTTTGTALNVTSTTIGANNLELRSISSNGGANSGIVLSNTGTLGGLTVAGTGGAGSGGTIQNKSVDGVSLNNTRNVSLTSMVITNNDGSGIFGDDVTNFSLIGSSVTNNADTTGGTEAGLRFNELLGTCAITNSTISGSVEDNIRMTPTSGVLTNLAISGSTIGPNHPTTGGSGIAIVTGGTAAMTVNITGSSFTGNRASGILTSLGSNAAHTINISTTSFQTHNTAIDLGLDFDADLTFNVSNNPTIVGNTANAINIVSGTTTTNAAQLRGTISGNTIGNGTTDSGSQNAFGIAVDLRGDIDAVLSITNNTVRNTDIEGIFVQARLDNDADAEIGRLDLTLRDNTVFAPDDNSAFPFGFVYGTRLESRNTTDVCLDIASNTSAGVGGAEHFRVRQRDTSIFRVERLALGPQNAATTAAFVAAENDGGSTASATVATNFTGVANGTCRKP